MNVSDGQHFVFITGTQLRLVWYPQLLAAAFGVQPLRASEVHLSISRGCEMVIQMVFVPGFHRSLPACAVALSRCFENSTAI